MRIRFDRGTLVLEAEHASEDPRQIQGATWDEQLCAWRVTADRHASVIGQLADSGVRCSDESRTGAMEGTWWQVELRTYQRDALASWVEAGRRGVIALPTGSGKTHVALAAIGEMKVPALVLVPTRVLLDQWSRAIAACWSKRVGRLGDGEHEVADVTVATYASAVTWMPRIGGRFGLVVVDEAHHVGAWCPGEVLEMATAHARLGLTATPPEEAHALRRHVGDVVFAMRVDELAGEALAPYQLVTVPIRLTRDERVAYREQRARFSGFYAPVRRSAPDASWREFVQIARQSKAGRAALEAWRTYRSLIAYPEEKRAVVRELLARHAGQRTLIFTSDNATAYAIARELLVMPITHEIGKAERARTLERFRAGEITVLVSAHVLDEGLDVPDAEVAIVVGGSSSKRRHVQRIGRVLRPRDGKRAVIYELAVIGTTEVGDVRRRREGLRHEAGAVHA